MTEEYARTNTLRDVGKLKNYRNNDAEAEFMRIHVTPEGLY